MDLTPLNMEKRRCEVKRNVLASHEGKKGRWCFENSNSIVRIQFFILRIFLVIKRSLQEKNKK